MAGEVLITVVGTLTAPPELKFTGSGVAVANFTIASNSRHYVKDTGKWEDDPAMFLRCSLWRDAAEHVVESLDKGSRVIAQGRLKQRSYEKDGQQRTVVELEVDEIGPSLRWATARIAKATRSGEASTPQVDDPWSTAPTTTPATGAPFDELPPF